MVIRQLARDKSLVVVLLDGLPQSRQHVSPAAVLLMPSTTTPMKISLSCKFPKNVGALLNVVACSQSGAYALKTHASSTLQNACIVNTLFDSSQSYSRKPPTTNYTVSSFWFRALPTPTEINSSIGKDSNVGTRTTWSERNSVLPHKITRHSERSPARVVISSKKLCCWLGDEKHARSSH